MLVFHIKKVERYPLVVHSRNEKGDTLCHYAVEKEDERLLGILLQANLARFWFPVNNDGIDILQFAVALKSRFEIDIFISCDSSHIRSCVKLILDRLIEAKQSNKLAPLPNKGDRFLRNLLSLTREFNDLSAYFLSNFGLDEDTDKVTYSRII